MSKILRLITLCFALVALALPAWAQEIQVKGQVVDDKGEEIVGAAVKVKETSQGIITDINGNFVVKAPKNGHLIISFLGYNPQTISLANAQLPLKVVLTENAKSLKEVVVVGYGSRRRTSQGRSARSTRRTSRRGLSPPLVTSSSGKSLGYRSPLTAPPVLVVVSVSVGVLRSMRATTHSSSSMECPSRIVRSRVLLAS